MKSSDQLKEFRALDTEKLTERVSLMQRELMNLEFRNAARQLQQTAQLRTVREGIARAKSVIREKAQQA